MTEGPLSGITVLVTRARGQAGPFARLFEAEGASVVECPLIEILPPADPRDLHRAVDRVRDYDWIVFTSVNGASAFLKALEDRSGAEAVRALSRLRIAAVGSSTERALLDAGVEVTLMPERFVAESLLEALTDRGPIEGKRVLVPTTVNARDVLDTGLSARGAHVDVVEAYRTTPVSERTRELRALLQDDQLDLATFTSPSAVESFHSNVDARLDNVTVAVIGPVTRKAAERLGYTVGIEARQHTSQGLVEACVDFFVASS